MGFATVHPAMSSYCVFSIRQKAVRPFLPFAKKNEIVSTMGKTKKPFIDKKQSSTYHLLYRSQRDVADANNESSAEGGVVLWPSPNNNKETDQKVLIGNKQKQDSSPDP